MPPKPILLRPAFTDTRSYIHGADLFDELVAATAAEGSARLRMVRLSDRPVALHFDAADPRNPDLCGYFDFTSGGGSSAPVSAWLSEDKGHVTERRPLMDKMILEAAQFAEASASVTLDPRFTPIKTAIVLGVALLERTMPDDVLNLGEIEVKEPLQTGRCVAVSLARRMAKFLMLSVTLDGRPHGRFTLAATPYVEASA